MINAIIFDLGNVLIGFDHHIAVKRILKYTDKSARDIYDFFFDSELTRTFEKGLIGPQEFFREVKKRLNLKISYDEFLPIWNEIFFPKPETEEFIRRLDGSLRLVLLSNINKIHFEYLRKNFSCALSLFDKMILSCMVGFIKPQRQIYELAISQTQADRKNIIYVDDRKDLIEAATGYGINSIRFEGIEQLRSQFERLGILFETTNAAI